MRSAASAPNLTVIACEHWTRDEWYDQTGLAWITPSPALRNLAAATLYPAALPARGHAALDGAGH